MQSTIHKQSKKAARARRTRSRIHGTKEVPRLHVFRSLKHISAQLIDDASSRTIVSVSEKELPAGKGAKTERAQALGELLGGKARKAGVERVIFDRGPYLYHGRIAAFADGARKAGLKF